MSDQVLPFIWRSTGGEKLESRDDVLSRVVLLLDNTRDVPWSPQYPSQRGFTMWEKMQSAFRFLSSLPALPKAIVSFVIVGAVAFLLVLMWFPPPPAPLPEPAVEDILSGCYRRALFTRMHAQLDTKAMVTSIDACRVTIQMNIPKIHRRDLKEVAVKLLATVDQILHENADNPESWPKINALKLQAIHSFKLLAAATGDSYLVPDDGKLAESGYFSNEEAARPLTQEEINAGNRNPMPLTQ